MVQITLYAGLGFLLALLLVLIVSPFLRRRTIRLTERRMRAALPQSIEEIRADRDSIRADYAMRVRQLEIKLDKLNDTVVERSLLLETRNEEIATQKTEIRQKLEIIAEFSDDLDEQRNVTHNKEEELARAKAKIRELASRLERKIKELERSEARFSELVATVEKQRSELIETRASLRTAESAAAGVAKAAIAASPASAGEPANLTFPDREQSDGGEIRVDPPMTSQAPPGSAPIDDSLNADEQTAELRIQITELEAAKYAAELRAKNSEDRLKSAEGKVTELEERLTEIREAGGTSDAARDSDERQARIFELEAQIGGLEADLAAKDSRISTLRDDVDRAKSIAGDNETLAALQTRLLDVEAEKAAFEAEVTRLTLELELAGSGNGASPGGLVAASATGKDGDIGQLHDMEKQLADAKSERDRAIAKSEDLNRELESRESLSESQRKIEQAEITLLRESLSDLAADVTHIVMTLEGENSPVNGILSASNGKADDNTFSDSPSGAIISLADRIKSLKARAVSAK